MSNEEESAYLSGEADAWFRSNSPKDAVTESGVVNWLWYRVGALFVHYLHDEQPDKFGKLIQLLLNGEKFDRAIKLSYGQDTSELLKSYTQYIKTHKVSVAH